MKSIVISSGHGKYVPGASGYVEEHPECVRIVDQVYEYLIGAGVTAKKFHDNTSHSQNENLNTIVNYHNSQTRDLDVSVHLNCNVSTSKPMGTECLYVTQEDLASRVAGAVATEGGFINRGPKYRGDLFFLNNTEKPAILIETFFCDSKADVELYNENFYDICRAIAQTIAEVSIPERPDGEPPPVESSGYDTIGKGDVGDDVKHLQDSISVVEADGDFGSITDAWVRGFQAACGIGVDGVVGPQTWEQVDDLNLRVSEGDVGLTSDQISQIVREAQRSPLMDYSWPDRGRAPPGYIPGMALCFAAALETQGVHVDIMSRAETGNTETDALAWYAEDFAELGMYNNHSGDETLRHLFVLMIGLGMRESSGRYFEGRDMSATNVEAETAEAGLFQTSWNIKTAHNSIPPLLNDYWNNPLGFAETFREDIEASKNNLSCYGKGDGAKYQWLSRFCPLFHTMVTGVGLRTRRQHWGPINRKEAALKREADELLKRVQEYLGGAVV